MSRSVSVAILMRARARESKPLLLLCLHAECGGESSAAAQTTKPSPSDPAWELEMRGGSFDEIEFLTKFSGNEEVVIRHFVTIHP